MAYPEGLPSKTIRDCGDRGGPVRGVKASRGCLEGLGYAQQVPSGADRLVVPGSGFETLAKDAGGLRANLLADALGGALQM
jgi:hypothetical protein